MASTWIVKRGERESGPFTSEELKTLASSGKLRANDLVAKKGGTRFVPAEKVAGLFADPPSKPSAKPSQNTSPKEALPVAEIIEDAIPEDGYEDYDAADFEEDEYEDYEEADFAGDDYEDYGAPSDRPSRKSRPAETGRSARKRKPGKKKSSFFEDKDNGPWGNLFGSVLGFACCYGLFNALGDGSERIDRPGGLKEAFLWLIYKIGGRWALCGVLSLIFLWMFLTAINQFRKRA